MRKALAALATVAPTMPAEPSASPPFPVELRERLARREPAALAHFFDAYFERVYGYLRRLVPDEHQAEDLTQDVFLQVHRALSSYDPTRDPRPWLFTIATNKLRDHWRARPAGGGGELSLDDEELGLGARAVDVLRLVAGEGMRPVVIGLGSGLLFAVGTSAERNQSGP